MMSVIASSETSCDRDDYRVLACPFPFELVPLEGKGIPGSDASFRLELGREDLEGFSRGIISAQAASTQQSLTVRILRFSIGFGPTPNLTDPPLHGNLLLHDSNDPGVGEHFLWRWTQSRVDP